MDHLASDREKLTRLTRGLRRNGVDYIVIGGQAIAEHVQTGTEDLDVLVALRDFDEALTRLKADQEFGDAPEERGWIAKFVISTGTPAADRIDFDVVSTVRYVKGPSANRFFDYIQTKWTYDGALGPTAKPEAVWYMRLLVDAPNQGRYAIKIRNNIRDGAPLAWFDGVREIAKEFGTLGEVEPRIRAILEGKV